jgi:serine/alanine adding enzyme
MSSAQAEEARASARAVAVRSDVTAAEIDRFAHAHPAATGYHLVGWLGVIERAFGHETMPLAAVSADGVEGLLPLVFFRSRIFGRFTVSMPFLNYGGLAADAPAVRQCLVDRAVEETRTRGGAHLELRHAAQLCPDLAPKRHKVSMRLTLEESPERQWEALDRKVRNQIRKGEKSQLSVSNGGVEMLDDFYAVFAHNMRDLGTPVYAKRFFDEILRTFPGTSRLFVVYHESRPVAASLVYWHRSMAEVPWASALRSSNPLSANVLLYWHMLKFSIERGFTVFDFGRSTPNAGTFHFKRQWGAQPLELVWEYWNAGGAPPPSMNPDNPKFDLAIRIWQRLPVSVATAIGPHVIRNIP